MLFKTKYLQLLALAGFVLPIIASTNTAVSYGGRAPRSSGKGNSFPAIPVVVADSDTVKLKYPIKDNKPYEKPKKGAVDLEDPPAVKKRLVYDEETGTYREEEVVAGEKQNIDDDLTLNEYLKRREKKDIENYFKERSQAQNFSKSTGLLPNIKLGPKIIDKIFGSGLIDLRLQGSAEVILGWNFNVVRNPALTARQQRNGQLDFKQKLQINLTGSIGDRVKINQRYDTEATFDFENQINLNWEGKEDDIIKKVELGNVSLPLNSSLISAGQSLFGAKLQMQFGRMMVTTIVTQQRGQTTETSVQGGAQVTDFNIQADNYDVNRHFFLGQYFANNYDNWLSTSPVISSPVVINRVEVWVTNRTGQFDNTRDILGFMDLGEGAPWNSTWQLPGNNGRPTDNASNRLYSEMLSPANAAARESGDAVVHLRDNLGLDAIADFQLLNNARQLNANEFTFDRRLGYISLNTSLNNDEILAVAYEYSVNGAVYKVGEFAREVASPDPNHPKVLMLKMLKGATITTRLPIWDLMMKNIYSLGSFNIKPEKFRLNVIYADDPSGADLNYLPAKNDPNIKGVPLISHLRLDKINVQQEPTPDGVFDFIDGITINSATGRIIFPVREPFGSFLRTRFQDPFGAEANYYIYQELYDSTKWLAQQVQQKNKFFLRGSYQGSSNSEISLNAINVPKGSVKVTANGTLLTENVDYVVDYTLGKVKILNSGILNSGAIIKVSAENNNLFSVQQKTLIGSRFDYKVNKDFLLGATVMHMSERPITPKVNIGDEPILNTIVGLDGSVKKDSRFITRVLDKLPFYSTKEMSNVQFQWEAAKLFAHKPRTIGDKGTSFIDDFEAAETPFDLKQYTSWYLSSTPEGQNDNFPENTQGGFGYSAKRGRMSWYTLDNIFTSIQKTSNPPTPSNLANDEDLSYHYTRQILVTEVFRNKNLQQGQPQALPTFDVAYFPYERGQYNFGVDGFNSDGTFTNPGSSWGGISRRIETNDFEAANIDYIEIWMLDPFIQGEYGKVRDGKLNTNNTTGGKLYINLGSVSEDVLRDTRKSYENGLPRNSSVQQLVDTTDWSRVPTVPAINNAFDAEPDSRGNQDVGMDGVNDDGERLIYDTSFLQKIRTQYGPTSPIFQALNNDPAGDNYKFHSSGDYDSKQLGTLERYKLINNQQGNSPLASFTPDGYPIARTNQPDDEDINRDFSLNINEDYYQYEIDLRPNQMRIGNNYIVDSVSVQVPLENGKVDNVTWYQLRVPINQFTRKVGNISDFKSIRFMRMFMREFQQPVVLRFAQMQLVRADWRRYLKSLRTPFNSIPTNPSQATQFSINAVNIEENAYRQPVNYVLPPGFFRELDVTTPGNVRLNEQSLGMKICNLQDGDAKAVFKNTIFDIRNYKRLKMYIHAESQQKDELKSGDVKAFIRLGTDLENNYYEYELPLTVTEWAQNSPESVWPSVNELNVELEEFYLTKQLRDNANTPLTDLFTRDAGDGKRFYIKGLPDFSNVRVIMLGVRNPLQVENNMPDDGQAKCGEFWFNELRVVEFVNKGGEAATARLVTKLADLGTLTLSGTYQSIGWGGIDKKLNDRNLNELLLYDLQTSIELGKFFPATWGVSIPFFLGRGEQWIRPKYNPLNPDVLLNTAIRAETDPEKKEEIRKNAIDYTLRRSYNFTNVRKNRAPGQTKARLYDIANFTGSFSFQEFYQHNQQLTENLQRTWKGSLGYSFSTGAKPIEPFKNIGSSKWLRIIKEFGITPIPASFNVRADLYRYYARLINRNNDDVLTITPVLYDKNFTMTRTYDFQWPLLKNLRIDYQSVVNARIDEPVGKIDPKEMPQKTDTIWNNFVNMGRTTGYQHRINANYQLPLNKLPILDWVNGSIGYSANYEWVTAPPAAPGLGNTIQNSQTINYQAQLNLTQLYNKIPYFKRVQSGQLATKKPEPKEEEEEEEEETDPKKRGRNAKKKPKKKVNDVPPGAQFAATLTRIVMMVKNINGTYSVTNGTVLPGFTPTPKYLGQDIERDAPGWDFVLGSQDPSVRYRIAENGFLTSDTVQNKFFVQTETRNLNIRTTVEPLKDFRIDFTFIRNETKGVQSLFKYDPNTSSYNDFGYQENGTFQMSVWTWKTAFGFDKKSFDDEAYTQMLNNRYRVANRLAAEDPRAVYGVDTATGFPVGYGDKQQNVLLYSFLAAYTDKSADNMTLDAFPKIPLPSWNVNYSGLSKLKAVKEFASSINIRHSYSSNYSVPTYLTAFVYSETLNTQDSLFTPKYEIKTVTITETFNPLSVNINFNSGLITNVEYRTTRNLNMNIANYTLVEVRSTEWVFGVGYRKAGLKLPFRVNRRRPVLKNDMNFRVDVSIRDAITITRNVQTLVNTPTQGQQLISIKPQIDYMINDKLNFRFYYDRKITNPYTSNSYPTRLTQGGISLRYTIQ